MELVSVIVPIYNVEKFIDKCIKSLIMQTYQKLEILLINDGSTDSSGLIANKYAESYDNIKVFHKKNGGLSDARNYGLCKATGKYICFLDSDDWIDSHTIEILYNNIVIYGADISEAQYIQVDNENCKIKNYTNSINVFNGVEASLNLRHYHLNQIVVWNKMYKRECFENIRFPVGKIHEDEFTTYKLLYNANSIVVTSQILFYYRKTPNSIINSRFSLKRLDILIAYDEALKFYFENKEKELFLLTLLNYLYILLDIKEKSKNSNDKKMIYQAVKAKYLYLCKKNWKILIKKKNGIKLLLFVSKWR